MPYMLELFTHPGCISREDGNRLVLDVLKHFPQVSFREIDIVAERQRASSLGIKISPTLVFNDKTISVGIPSVEELGHILRKALKEVSRVS